MTAKLEELIDLPHGLGLATQAIDLPSLRDSIAKPETTIQAVSSLLSHGVSRKKPFLHSAELRGL